ncbi:MAG: cyclic nucleotide-binding domain (cNMP-BD) protein [Ramlibacter sp.]|nr:cyclic nucleotide-binding domain (cNMP-BD) protein [Ramlibacter sp.]
MHHRAVGPVRGCAGWRADGPIVKAHTRGLDPSQNELIAGLGPKARNSLLDLGETAPLALSQVLSEAGGAVRHVYFPVEGFISLVAVVEDSPGIEVGMIGTEGMLGASLALGVTTQPVRAIVQGAGTAWRIPAPAFRAELERSARLRRAVSRYLFVLLCQHASAAVCLRFHLIGPRLARWLLMSQDRAHSDRFHVTQEFLSYMMGVRREGVTQAAGDLQRQGLIAYRRGEMHVLDRAGLEAAACACYGAERAIYADIFR